MTRTNAAALAMITIALACLFAAPATSSAQLATDPNAYFDGFTTWHGSTNFGTGTLTGYVEWAVYAPGDFPYAANGYTPTPGEMVYAYQVFVTGTSPLSAISVGIINPANNIGDFTLGGGLAPTSDSLVAFVGANWFFSGINQGGLSSGLAFSSPMLPMHFLASVIDTGQTATVVPVPSPDSFPIPEPATWGLAALALAGLVVVRRRWGRR